MGPSYQSRSSSFSSKESSLQHTNFSSSTSQRPDSSRRETKDSDSQSSRTNSSVRIKRVSSLFGNSKHTNHADSRGPGLLRRLKASFGGKVPTQPQTKQPDTSPLQTQLRSLISSVIMDREKRRLVKSLAGDNARLMIDYLNMTLHEANILPCDEKKRMLSSLCRLAKATGIYPRYYMLEGVERGDGPIEGGTFADVYKGTYQGESMALKVLRVFPKWEKDKLMREHAKELVLWAHLSHENVLPFFGVYQFDTRICLVSPWMENGDLENYLHEHPGTPRMPYIPDIVNGLVYLHQSRVVHGDLRAKNILLSDDGRALIADFGVSHVATTSGLISTSLLSSGTTRWKAPELFGEDPYAVPTRECDIWSLACVFYEVLAGKLPFYEYHENHHVIGLLSKGNAIPTRPLPGKDSNLIDDGIWNIMMACWNDTPEKRLTSEEIRASIAALKIKDNRPGNSAETWDASAFWREMRVKSGDELDYEKIQGILDQIQSESCNHISIQQPSL